MTWILTCNQMTPWNPNRIGTRPVKLTKYTMEIMMYRFGLDCCMDHNLVSPIGQSPVKDQNQIVSWHCQRPRFLQVTRFTATTSDVCLSL